MATEKPRFIDIESGEEVDNGQDAPVLTRQRVPVRHILTQFGMEELSMLEPFYVTNIRREASDFANAPEDENGKYVMLFDCISDDGEFIGTSKTATRGIVQQLESMLREAGPNAEYGPVKVGKPMVKAKGDEPARPSKAYKFVSA
jgi:hypothetical protein